MRQKYRASNPKDYDQCPRQYAFLHLVLLTTGGEKVEVPPEECLTAPEVAQLKEVSRAAVYVAIKEHRLPAVKVGGSFIIPRLAALQWIPVETGERTGAKRRGGRPVGSKMSKESKARIANSQRLRWAEKKKARTNAAKTAHIPEEKIQS